MIGTCTKCGNTFDGSLEDVCEPGTTLCPPCYCERAARQAGTINRLARLQAAPASGAADAPEVWRDAFRLDTAELDALLRDVGTLPPDPEAPLSLAVQGRGRLTATATAVPYGVLVRLEDDARDEFWAELLLPAPLLEELLRRARAAVP